MIRRLGMVYRKDKALSKAALGFIQVILENAAQEQEPVNLETMPRLARR